MPHPPLYMLTSEDMDLGTLDDREPMTFASLYLGYYIQYLS